MNERDFLQSFLCFATGFCCLVVSSFALGNERMRIWTSADGKELEAALVNVEEESVTFLLPSGRESRVPLDRLSEADRRLVKMRAAELISYVTADLPEETTVPSEIAVSGGPDRYLTPNFSFETEEPVSRAFISEAARVYEGTFQALAAIPHGLSFSPPGTSRHFQGSFMSDQRFDAIARSKMASIPGQRVVGLYLGSEQRLLVPYSSLGAKKLGSQLTLRKRSDTTTLVHEIVHQVMHRYLPVLPTWFSEGTAEYISALPYQSGRFEFRNAERGLKERLKNEYRSDGLRVDGVMPPSFYLVNRNVAVDVQSSVSNSDSGAASREVIASPKVTWQGTVSEYRDALLLVYYFMHLDQPERSGYPVGAFLQETDRAMNETESIVKELKRFESERLAYNDSVQGFNDALDEYEAEAKVYNLRVEQYNEQLRNGFPEDERIDVGTPPGEPTRPEAPVLPERLRELSGGSQRIDLVALVEKKALSALILGRSPESIDARMQEEFSGIGIKISYRR
ncbi:MAG: hypothetical protein P1U58_11260 [Verrucomicrobiales bacterium]|nr:hypothetical protein [Verrucomicrobiales bacterium]